MNSYLDKQELDELNSFFAKAEKMTEEEIQVTYNCDDTKEEFLDYLQQEIELCEENYNDALQEEESASNWRTSGLDPAFRSWKEVYSMFI